MTITVTLQMSDPNFIQTVCSVASVAIGFVGLVIDILKYRNSD